MDGVASLTIKDGEVFWTAEDASAFVPIVCLIICPTNVSIVGSFSDVATSAIYTAWCSLTNQFSMSGAE